MGRPWFRHDANMRHDPAVSQLGKDFGPAGIVAWTSLCELHCADDAGIRMLREDLSAALALDPAWNLDVNAWLKRAAQLRLITVKKPSGSRPNLVLITARSWARKNPAFESREAANQRKAKSRGKPVTVTSPPGHSDVPGTSHGTDVTVRSTPLPPAASRSKPQAKPTYPAEQTRPKPRSETSDQADARARSLGLIHDDHEAATA